jgi:hypothetical protein
MCERSRAVKIAPDDPVRHALCNTRASFEGRGLRLAQSTLGLWVGDCEGWALPTCFIQVPSSHLPGTPMAGR